MNDDLEFESYLFLSPNKSMITICEKKNIKILYKEKFLLKGDLNSSNFESLDNFLNDNIFKIEKSLKSFLKNIFIVLDYKVFFPVQLSLKKSFSGKILSQNDLNYILNDSKFQCQETLKNKKIIHMVINNFKINKKDYSFLPKDLPIDEVCVDISFICLSENFIKNLEAVLKKYHISLDRIISGDYMNNLFKNSQLDPIQMAKQTVEGFNKNEVVMAPKNIENKGFFEKFFHFFS
tara:strand:- start:272 stop:976 length:705 start_codon:yes stop_codon:yes gene_type:complete